MPKYKNVESMRVKRETQRKIIYLHGEKIIKTKQKELCTICENYNPISKKCTWQLIPVTISGDSCPYYKKLEHNI